MKSHNILFLLFFLSTQLFSSQRPLIGTPEKQSLKRSRLSHFSPAQSEAGHSVSCPSTSSRQKHRSFLQNMNAKTDSRFLHFSEQKVEEMVEDLLNPLLENHLNSVLKSTTKSARKKCHLAAGFSLVTSLTHEIVAHGIIDESFYSSKHHKIHKGRLKHRGLHVPVGSHKGLTRAASAIHHHHSERAFFSALSDPRLFIKFLSEAGINPSKMEDGQSLGIILYNKLSSCSICHSFMGQQFSSSLCSSIQLMLEKITGKKLYVFISHKGKFHHRNKENKSPTVSERYYSSDFFDSKTSSNLFHEPAARVEAVVL